MNTKQEAINKFISQEQSKKLQGVKNKAANELRNLQPVDKALVLDLIRLKEAHGLNKIYKLLQIINLSEQ